MQCNLLRQFYVKSHFFCCCLVPRIIRKKNVDLFQWNERRRKKSDFNKSRSFIQFTEDERWRWQFKSNILNAIDELFGMEYLFGCHECIGIIENYETTTHENMNKNKIQFLINSKQNKWIHIKKTYDNFTPT